MTLVYHPAVQADFNEAIAFYEAVGENLADRFEAEFKSAIVGIKAHPRSFPFYLRSRVFRRVRLVSFPFVIIFREHRGGIRVTALIHEKRRPQFGLRRR